MQEMNNFKTSKYVQCSIMYFSVVERYDNNVIYISPVHPVTLMNGIH